MCQDAMNMDFDSDDPIVYVSPTVAAYNSMNSDHGYAPIEPGFYIRDSGDGPFKSEAEALEYVN